MLFAPNGPSSRVLGWSNSLKALMLEGVFS